SSHVDSMARIVDMVSVHGALVGALAGAVVGAAGTGIVSSDAGCVAGFGLFLVGRVVGVGPVESGSSGTIGRVDGLLAGCETGWTTGAGGSFFSSTVAAPPVPWFPSSTTSAIMVSTARCNCTSSG